MSRFKSGGGGGQGGNRKHEVMHKTRIKLDQRMNGLPTQPLNAFLLGIRKWKLRWN